MATLTYVYADSTVVVGPLATYAEPHSYDLCAEHAVRLTAPRGWAVVRQDVGAGTDGPVRDDLAALADAVRETARDTGRRQPAAGLPPGPDGDSGRGHLRLVRSPK